MIEMEIPVDPKWLADARAEIAAVQSQMARNVDAAPPQRPRVLLRYIGWQEAVSGPGFGLFNVVRSESPRLVPGTTVTLGDLQKLGVEHAFSS
jgi:hypothetical protein